MQKIIDSLSDYYKNNTQVTDYESTSRQKAFSRFISRGMPSRKDEAWRYANIANCYSQSLQQPEPNDSFSLPKEYSEIQPDILVVDGFVRVLTENLGIDVMSLQDAMITYPEKVQDYLSKAQDNNVTNNPFVDFNAAAWSSGLFVEVQDNFKQSNSLNILYINTGSFFLNNLNILLLGKNTELSISEHYYGKNSYNVNNVTNIYLDIAANLTHEILQQDGNDAIRQNYVYVKQLSSSSYKQRCYSFGAKFYRAETVVDFKEPNAEAEYVGVDFTTKDNWHATNFKAIHNASNCISRQQFRSIVSTASSCSFLGHILVPQGVEASAAYQDSKSLLLGETARANVKPYLEIFSDDVVCTHSANIGNLDENSVFYLRARGYNQPLAYLVLLQAFVHELISVCSDENIKSIAENNLENLSSHVFLDGIHD